MKYRYAFHFLVVFGLLGAAVVFPRAALGDQYSGLSDRATDAYAGQGSSLPPGASGAGRQFDPSPVARTPEAPMATGRPATWPGQAAQYPDTGCRAEPWVGGVQPRQGVAGCPTGPISVAGQPALAGNGAQQPLPVVETKSCEDAKVVARVGTEVILAGDVIAIFVNDRLEELDGPIPEEYREKVLQSALSRAIATKLVYLDAKRSIPEENFPNVEKELRSFFHERAVPDMMKRAKVKTVDELGQKLADLGTSMQWQQQTFMEFALGQEWKRTKVKFEGPVSPDQMLTYYREHATDYDHPARARWEELTVEFDNSPSREAAYQKLAQLGNQVKDGLPMAEAARRGSDGATAASGGTRDWTTRGSLVSQQLDTALFGLPIGQLSPILETETGLHIVRVVERQDAYRTPFTEVQDKIRKTLQKHRGEKEAEEYFAKLKESTPVWTIYDEAMAKKNSRQAGGELRRR